MKNQKLSLILQSILPLAAFYLFEHFCGLKIAIAATVVVTIAEIIYRKIRKETLDVLFWSVSIMTIGFGIIDLYSENASLFKYEPALSSLAMGIFFTWGAWKPKPLLLEMVEKAKKLPEPVAPELVLYLRVFTWIWVVYFMVKAGVYFWLAKQPDADIGSMMVIRTIAGNASLGVMLAFSWLGGKPIYKWIRSLKRFQSEAKPPEQRF